MWIRKLNKLHERILLTVVLAYLAFRIISDTGDMAQDIPRQEAANEYYNNIVTDRITLMQEQDKADAGRLVLIAADKNKDTAN